MKILFCNTRERQCGVFQYGLCFFDAINASKKIEFRYDEPTSIGDVNNWIEKEGVGAIVVNWHPDIAGWQSEAVKISGAKKILVYHDYAPEQSAWDAILFSDPMMIDHGKWFSIPRPIPSWQAAAKKLNSEHPIIGTHGFYGASAHHVAKHVSDQFESATIRVHAPLAAFGDPEGKLASDVINMARDEVSRNPGIKLEVTHDFMAMPELLRWLEQNDLNCYLRDSSAEWLGVSSALDAALAVRRPIAVTYCKGFRHVHGLTPSICIEDRTMPEILETGIEPLKPIYAANTRQKMIERVEDILGNLL